MNYDGIVDSSGEGSDLTALEFAENPDLRAPIVLVLDCSDSMLQVREGESRSPFDSLNGGLDVLWSGLKTDELASRRAEVSFITYGSDVSEPTPFATTDKMDLPSLVPMGLTSTGKALTIAMDAIEERKNIYKSNGVQYYRPTLMLISDGLPTDDTTEASARLRDYQKKGKLNFLPVAVEGADTDALSALSNTTCLKLQGMKFDELFQWLSASVTAVSHSQPSDRTPMPDISGWATL